MGALKFIKSTENILLPLIVNIASDSIDEKAIKKYAGSSFTKNSDLTRFKSIMVSFFMIAKECLMKWAEWISTDDYKFNAAFVSAQKKGVRFEYELKYFRQENEINFKNNCRKNGHQFKSKKGASSGNAQTQMEKKPAAEFRPIQSEAPMKDIKETLPRKNSSSKEAFRIGKRAKTQSKDKHIIKCHQIFKNYDRKLESNTFSEKDIQEINNKVNQHLSEYMSSPGLDDNVMETEIEAVFLNISNITKDYEDLKKFSQINKQEDEGRKKRDLQLEAQEEGHESSDKASKSKEVLTNQVPQSKRISVKKTESKPNSNRKIPSNQHEGEDSHLKYSQINSNTNSDIPKFVSVKEISDEKPSYDEQLKKQKFRQMQQPNKQEKQGSEMSQKKSNQLIKIEKERKRDPPSKRQEEKDHNQRYELSYNRDIPLNAQPKKPNGRNSNAQIQDSSYISSKIKGKVVQSSNSEISSQKGEMGAQIRETAKFQLQSKSIISEMKQKSPSLSSNVGRSQNTNNLSMKKSSTKEIFDSKLDFSNEQSSRVNFSGSSEGEGESDEDESSIKQQGFKKPKESDLRLSAIPEEDQDGHGDTSRRIMVNNYSPIYNSESKLRKGEKKQIASKQEPQEKYPGRRTSPSHSYNYSQNHSHNHSHNRSHNQQTILYQNKSNSINMMNGSANKNMEQEIPKETRSKNSNSDSHLQNRPNKEPSIQFLIKSHQLQITRLKRELNSKDQKESELQKILNELSTEKDQKERELQRIKDERAGIIRKINNTVSVEEYEGVKKHLNDVKENSFKMESKMEMLLREIDSLKKRQETTIQKGYGDSNSHGNRSQTSHAMSPNEKIGRRMFEEGESSIQMHKNENNKENNYKMGELLLKDSQIIREIQNQPHNSHDVSDMTMQRFNNPIKETVYKAEKLDNDYANNLTSISNIHNWMGESNLVQFEKAILTGNELFHSSDMLSILCKTTHFEVDAKSPMALRLEFSFQINNLKTNVKPSVKYFNIQLFHLEVELWKKQIIGEDSLFHQQVIVNLKQFPLRLMKMEVKLSEHQKVSLLMPFLYFSFLKASHFNIQEFEDIFEINEKQSVVKSKVFTLNHKILSDISQIERKGNGKFIKHENRVLFFLHENGPPNSLKRNEFWGQICSLSKQKCFTKILALPFNPQNHEKARRIINDIVFLLS